MLPSVSYAPFEPGHTVADVAADSEKVRADLKKLSTLTRAVRLYSSTEGNELVPPIAAEFGLKVTVGAWIDKDADRNEREIEAAINLAQAQQQRHRRRGRQRNHLPRRAEPIENLRPDRANPRMPRHPARGKRAGAMRSQPRTSGPSAEMGAAENNVHRLIKLIQRVKKSVNVPVTTGEIWNIWRDHPRSPLGRFHRRPRPALLGKLHRQAGGRSGGRSSTSCCASSFPASAS